MWLVMIEECEEKEPIKLCNSKLEAEDAFTKITLKEGQWLSAYEFKDGIPIKYYEFIDGNLVLNYELYNKIKE